MEKESKGIFLVLRYGKITVVVNMFKDGQIIITSSVGKTNLLKKLSDQLINIKIYAINEFNKLFYFDYNEETIYYIMKKYNVKYEIAKIYIDNMYYIEDKDYDSEKLAFLCNLKEELIEKKLLKINRLFINTLKNREIVLYNLPSSLEIDYLNKKLSINNRVIVISEDMGDYKHTIYELKTIEDEVTYVANQICTLIKNGIPLSKIYLTNLNEEYRKLIKRIFPSFKIPVTLDGQESIYTTFIATKFFELYQSDLSVTLEALREYATTSEAEDILSKIVDIVNKYTFVDDKMNVYEMIKYDFKNTKLRKKDNVNSIHEVSLMDTEFLDDEYVFLLSFNQGIIPAIHKDEKYLTDKERSILGISLTVDMNNLEKFKVQKVLSNVKNLIIAYKLQGNGEDFNISSINEVLGYEVEKVNENILVNSDLNNKIKLAGMLDEYYKYGTKSELLGTLNKHYSDLDYKTYNHTFKGIDKEDLKVYLDNKLTLSYSSLDKYYRCPFSFYIGNILKLNIYEETFYQLVGTLFHSILEKFTSSNLEYDELWNREVAVIEEKHEFTNKERFFLNKLKDELKFIIETIQEQENFTNLHDELHEERVYTSISGEMRITFTGIIDKIKYKKYGDETIVAIIDYKTGNPNLDLTTVPYGIGMQLPIYLYLAKNSKRLENVKVAGFYLQKVLNNEVTVDKTHSYEQLKKKNLLLQGFSNEDMSILSEFDHSYMDSNIIKSMKVKNDNSFYSYVKVLSSKQMDLITNMAEAKIKEGAALIGNGEFKVSPKKIEKVNYGCNLCKFKDICFHTNDDVEELNKLTMDDVLGVGGESNGVDEGTRTSD